MANGNFLNFTNLTYDEIKKDITNRLNADPRFENFTESSIAQTIIEIFASTTDLTNYYLERRAEEQYFDTARLKSSVILLSKILGYIVTRPIPAYSSISITIKGPLPPGLEAGDTVYFTKFNTKFQHNGYPYILEKTYKYTFTAADIADGVGNASFSKTINVAITNEAELELNEFGNVPLSATEPISIVQGEIIVNEILGSSNEQIGDIFQKYDINDTRFSNYYGEKDFSYDVETNTFSLLDGITKVGKGLNQSIALENETNLYQIDRRSLLTSPDILDQVQIGETPNVCLIRTRPNSEVEIVFGDGSISSKGAELSTDNIYVQYFATDGSAPNKVGVKTELIQTSNTFTVTGKPSLSLSNNLEFRLFSNITGGADMESIESIKLNSPSLFFSLDRLVSKKDYISYLKSMTSPINVKNALAWGEQEEISNLSNLGVSEVALIKMFNIVFFTVLGELYNMPNNGEYTVKNLYSLSSNDYPSTLLEGDHFITNDINPAYGEQTYFNVYCKKSQTSCTGGGIIETLNIQEGLAALDNVKKVVTDLQTRAQITTKNIYISPIIQQFSLSGNVYLRNLSSLNDVRIRINNQIYSFLNNNADFNVPIYMSNIIDIIDSNREVLNCDISFESMPSLSGTFVPVTTIATDPDVVGTGLVSPFDEEELVYLLESVIFEYKNYSESSFYLELISDIYNNKLNDYRFYEYRDSNTFKQFVSRLNKTFKEDIRDGIIDDNGNITNYSLSFEIAQILSNLTYRYKL